MDVEKALRTRHRANQISGNSWCLRQKLCLMACLFGQLHHQKQQAIAKRIAFAITSTVINIFLQRFVLDKKRRGQTNTFQDWNLSSIFKSYKHISFSRKTHCTGCNIQKNISTNYDSFSVKQKKLAWRINLSLGDQYFKTTSEF